MSDTCMKQLYDMKKALVDYTMEVVDCGLDQVDTHELGEVVDVIKDLYQAEKYCYEACYYKSKVDDSPYTLDRSQWVYTDNDADEAMNTLKAIWGSSTSESKIKMKSNLTKLLEEMVI